MEIQFFTKADDFLSEVSSSLDKDEVRYGLIYGISKRLADDPHSYGEDDPWFCTIGDGTAMHAVAIRTPPFRILLAHFSGDTGVVAARLAESISEFSGDIPGVTGDKELTDAFVECWTKHRNVRVAEKMLQRIYKLTRVSQVKLSEGRCRPALPEDTAKLADWSRRFHEATDKLAGAIPPILNIDKRISNNDLYIWENGIPVSMAAKARPIRNGIRIGFVFTPAEHRGKGYATSCVASLAQNILDSGYKFCTLYTDLANPLSNSIYKKIGFQEVCDAAEYSFSKTEE